MNEAMKAQAMRGPSVVEHSDEVNHPPHYNSHPMGIECIDVVEFMNFNLGNAIKYVLACRPQEP